MDALYTALLLVVLLLSAALGLWARRQMDPGRLTRDTIESIRLLMGMMLTFAAIVLGLLTSNAKQRFDGLSADLQSYGAELIELDDALRAYGEEAAPIRIVLRRYTALVIADTWPSETGPDDQAAKPSGSLKESETLGQLLEEVSESIARLDAADAYHGHVGERARDHIASVMAQRWRIIALAGPTTSWPFLLILTSWLCIIFAIAGMTSPPGRVLNVVMFLSALSIASPLYLILEYDDALEGGIVLSSAPMRTALAHMDAR